VIPDYPGSAETATATRLARRFRLTRRPRPRDNVKRHCSSSKALSLRFLLEHEGAQLFFDLAESPIG
jgi:hypothetical protein